MEIYFDIIPRELNGIILHYLDIPTSDNFLKTLEYYDDVVTLCISKFHPKIFDVYLYFSKYYDKKEIFYVISKYTFYLYNALNGNIDINLHMRFMSEEFDHADYFSRRSDPIWPNMEKEYDRCSINPRSCRFRKQCGIKLCDNPFCINKYINFQLFFELIFRIVFPLSYNKIKSQIKDIDWVSLYPGVLYIFEYALDNVPHQVALNMSSDDEYDQYLKDMGVVNDKNLIGVLNIKKDKLIKYKELQWIIDN